MTDARRHEGSCLCGAFRFEVSSKALATFACHCRGCQKLTSAPYSLTAMFPLAAFRVLSGEAVPGGLHGKNGQYFCDHCKSWLYTRLDGWDDVINVRSILFDSPEAFPPYFDVSLDEALPGVSSGARIGFASNPGEGEFAKVMAESAQFLAELR